MTRGDIGVIVLAAGGSSRLGSPKQLLEFEGKSLLRRAVETAIESKLGPVVVVLGAAFDDVQKEILHLAVEIVRNDDWLAGMSSSVVVGLDRLETVSPLISAVIFMLCDQPMVNSETLRRLADAYEGSKLKIVASEYNETLGVPALFDRSLFDELRSLSGDKGAKAIINKHVHHVMKTPVPEAATDVDTLGDLQRLTEKRKGTTKAVPN